MVIPAGRLSDIYVRYRTIAIGLRADCYTKMFALRSRFLAVQTTPRLGRGGFHVTWARLGYVLSVDIYPKVTSTCILSALSEHIRFKKEFGGVCGP